MNNEPYPFILLYVISNAMERDGGRKEMIYQMIYIYYGGGGWERKEMIYLLWGGGGRVVVEGGLVGGDIYPIRWRINIYLLTPINVTIGV